MTANSHLFFEMVSSNSSLQGANDCEGLEFKKKLRYFLGKLSKRSEAHYLISGLKVKCSGKASDIDLLVEFGEGTDKFVGDDPRGAGDMLRRSLLEGLRRPP